MLMILKYISIEILVYLILSLYGFPFMLFLKTEGLKKYWLVICPLFGLSIGMVLMFYFNLLGFSVIDMAIPMTAVFGVADFILARKKNLGLPANKKIYIFQLVGIVVVTCIFTLPGILKNSGNIAITLGNNDFVLYTAISNAVKYHSVSYVTEHFGQVAQWINGIQNRHMAYWIAYISYIFRISIFNAGSVLAILLFEVIINALVTLCDYLSEGENRKKIIVVSIMATLFNCNLVYIYYQSFFAQLASVAYMIIITVFLFEMMRDDKISKKESVSMGIMVAGMGATYGEMVPIIAAPMVILLICYFIIDRNRFKILFLNYLMVITTVLVVFARMLYTSIKMLIVSDAVTVGWDIVEGFYLQAVGVYNTFLCDFTRIKFPSVVVIVVSVVLVLTLIIWTYKNIQKNIRTAVIVLLIVYCIFYAVFLVKYDLYKAFKGMLNMSYIFIAITVLFLCRHREKRLCRKLSNVVLIIIMVLIAINGSYIYLWGYECNAIFSEGYHAEVNSAGEDYNELQFYLDNNSYNEIYVAGMTYWDSIAALTMSEKYDVPVQDVNRYLWGCSNFGIPIGNAIVIDSSTLPEPISFLGDVKLKNNVYTVKNIDLNYPYCTNKQDAGILTITGKDDDSCLTGGRHIFDDNEIKNEINLYFYIEVDKKLDVGIKLLSYTEGSIEIIMPDGQSQNVDLTNGVNEIYFDNVDFKMGYDNIISILEEENYAQDVYLESLYYDNESPELVPFKSVDLSKYFRIPGNLKKYIMEITSKINTIGNERIEISFLPGGNYNEFINSGLWSEETAGIWSQKSFRIICKVKAKENLVIEWTNAQVYKNFYDIHVYVNGRNTGILSINEDGTIQNYVIDNQYLTTKKNNIEIQIDNITSPQKENESTDIRELGIFLSSINLYLDNDAKASVKYPIYVLGTEVDFTNESKEENEYIVSGMSQRETIGTWIEGESAEFNFFIDDSIQYGDTLQCNIFIADIYNAPQNLKIFVNNVEQTDVILSKNQLLQFEFECPKNHIVKLELQTPGAVSPRELGESDDNRSLSIMLNNLVIQEKSRDM